MVKNFDAAVIDAVLAHMNDDHNDDNLLIARANGYPDATASVMADLNQDAGVWRAEGPEGTREITVAWPSAPLTERPQIRRDVVLVYQAACKTLGVPAREEHKPAADANPHGEHGGHGHGGHGASPHGHGGNPHAHGGNPHAAAAEHTGPKPFSQVIRESSWGDHSDSEGATFMEDIMRGVATKQDYIDLVIQHYFMYVALEAAATQLATRDDAELLHPAALVRLPALEEDLEFLVGADWREQIAAVPATAAYAARITEIGEEGWAAGVIAHHYTRYLGDLSGGQMIAKRVAKQHGFDDGRGISFYNFAELGDLAEFKTNYRTVLDSLGDTLDEAEQKRMCDEVRQAYAFNTQVFIDLGKQKAARAAN